MALSGASDSANGAADAVAASVFVAATVTSVCPVARSTASARRTEATVPAQAGSVSVTASPMLGERRPGRRA